jgi:hypothetical protein
VKTEGKMTSKKESFKKSIGDEADTDNESKKGIFEVISKTKVLGVSLWIWGLLVVAIIVALWIISSNSPVPIEHME